MIKETSGLIEEISVRQTNRGIYSGEMIPSDQLSYLRNTPLEENISLHLWSKGEWEFDTLSSYIFAGNNWQMNDRLFKRELKSWMRFNKNHVRATSDGLSYAVFGAPNLPRLISETIMGSVLKAGIQEEAGLFFSFSLVRLTDKYATGMVCARPEFATFSFESYGKEYRFRLFEPAL